jgi:NADPH:quinone reductase-like Zn-dependent oxidoreductase
MDSVKSSLMMRAAYLIAQGGHEVIRVGARRRLVHCAGEVLVRIGAATMKRVDLYTRDSRA